MKKSLSLIFLSTTLAGLVYSRQPTEQQLQEAVTAGQFLEENLESTITSLRCIVQRLEKTKTIYDLAQSHKTFISAPSINQTNVLLNKTNQLIKDMEKNMQQLREHNGVWVDLVLEHSGA